MMNTAGPRTGTFLLLAACAAETEGKKDDHHDDTAAPEGDLEVDWATHDDVGSIIVVTWEQEEQATGRVHYRFEGTAWEQTPDATCSEGSNEQLVLGVPFDTELELQVVLDDGTASEVITAETGPLPEPNLQPEVTIGDTGLEDPEGRYLLGSINASATGWSDGEYWMYLVDRQGRVVWAWLSPEQHFCIHAGVSLDGDDIVWDELTYWTEFDGGSGGQAHRMKIDGTIVESYAIPGANHAFTELTDGSIAWWAMGEDSLSSYDGWLRVLGPDGEVETVWDCGAFLDEHTSGGVCLANTVFWNEADDTFLISFAMEDFVVEVDHATGETLRWWGAIEGDWSFDPEESQFWVQHSVGLTGAGTLLLSTHVDSDSNEGVVREYEIDDDSEVLRQVWTFGEGEGTEARLGGYVERLDSGNTLHNYGTTPVVKEITAEGEVAWQLEWEHQGMLGRTVFVDDLYEFLP